MEQLENIDDWDEIASEGGPLIFMPNAAMKDWDGARPSKPPKHVSATFRYADANAPATDYDRACDVSGYLCVIHVGDHEALVIGDEPSSTTLVRSKSGRSLLIAKWDYGPDSASVAASMASIDLRDFPAAELSLRLTTSPQAIFDSGAPGDKVDRFLEASLPPGVYDVSTLEFRPTSDISLVLHWLRPSKHV